MVIHFGQVRYGVGWRRKIPVSRVGWASPTICILLIACAIGPIQRLIAMFDPMSIQSLGRYQAIAMGDAHPATCANWKTRMDYICRPF